MSHKLLHGARSLQSAKKQVGGRRTTASDVTREAAHTNEQIARLSTSQQTKAQLVERHIGGILAGASLPR